MALPSFQTSEADGRATVAFSSHSLTSFHPPSKMGAMITCSLACQSHSPPHPFARPTDRSIYQNFSIVGGGCGSGGISDKFPPTVNGGPDGSSAKSEPTITLFSEATITMRGYSISPIRAQLNASLAKDGPPYQSITIGCRFLGV